MSSAKFGPDALGMAPAPAPGRPSVSSGGFSDYDDLQDFDGRFESRSTLGRASAESTTPAPAPPPPEKRGIFGRFRKASGAKPPAETPPPPPGKRLRGLRSVSSLKAKSAATPSPALVATPSPPPTLPALPPVSSSSSSLGPAHRSKPSVDGLGIEAVQWMLSQDELGAGAGAGGSLNEAALRRRALSHPAKTASLPALPSSPSASRLSVGSGPGTPGGGSTFSGASASTFGGAGTSTSTLGGGPGGGGGAAEQAALANALLAASHAEAAPRGVHADLLQILNHAGRPWGFAYADYACPVRVWYGERDEKIAEGAVRWMERTMGPETCAVRIVPGADHALMYNPAVVIEALEHVRDAWH
jgi:hypothetical protein